MSFIQVGSFQSQTEAHVVKRRFEIAGILCWLKEGNQRTPDRLAGKAQGGVKIMVAKEQLTEAKALLEEIEKEKRLLYACPSCGSSNIEHVLQTRASSGSVLSALRALFRRVMSTNKSWRCRNCGSKFKVPVNTQGNSIYPAGE